MTGNMTLRFSLWLTAAALMAAPALAAEPAKMADVHRLSPADVKAILDQVAAKGAASDKPAARQIEGEIGVGIGTGGRREAYGTAVVPLGQDATAILSIDALEADRRRGKRRR